MKSRQTIVILVALVLMLGAAGGLAWLKSGQRLGAPGVKTEPIPGSARLAVVLPEKVLDFDSEPVEPTKLVLDTLPQDTSFGQRHYKAADGFETLINVVLMGTDRTSLHKPQFCLVGGGWRIDRTEIDRVRIYRPQTYDLPVVKLTTSREAVVNGQTVPLRGVYVYWFVCDEALSGEDSGLQRAWLMARELVRSGKLQRWAYVTCFSVCPPGQEEATYTRMKRFLAGAVPEFQLTPKPEGPAPTPAP
ncbi:MAG TPA: exosortase-associated EpsI family protein [Verrucomicrobiae bacterium]